MRVFSKLIVSFYVTLLRAICYGNFPIYQKLYSAVLKLVAFFFFVILFSFFLFWFCAAVTIVVDTVVVVLGGGCHFIGVIFWGGQAVYHCAYVLCQSLYHIHC